MSAPLPVLVREDARYALLDLVGNHAAMYVVLMKISELSEGFDHLGVELVDGVRSIPATPLVPQMVYSCTEKAVILEALIRS